MVPSQAICSCSLHETLLWPSGGSCPEGDFEQIINRPLTLQVSAVEETFSELVLVVLCEDSVVEMLESFTLSFRIVPDTSPVTYIPTISEAAVLVTDTTGSFLSCSVQTYHCVRTSNYI